MSKIINQKMGNNWASYNGDCVMVMRGLPENSIDFSVFSPPFLALYIYSDSIADLGNTDSEGQFFEGWKFHLQELFRVIKPGKAIAIHCKDTMRYMSSHGYAGLYDFPGKIIECASSVGFIFDRWLTIWKDPVVEMQRTKTYGLLHKSFCERGEVTRQGCADYTLVFRKPPFEPEFEMLPEINENVIERCVHIWTNKGESIFTPLLKNIRNRQQLNNGQLSYSFYSQSEYSNKFINSVLRKTQPGRNATIHCTARMMVDLVSKFEAVDGWKFHSRTSLTDGSFLITFRNWSGEFENNVVKHSLNIPEIKDWSWRETIHIEKIIVDGEVEFVEEDKQSYRQPLLTGNEKHPDYVGLDVPVGWHDRTYYSILVWQRYASPVWFDLEGLPREHKNCLMDIQQTNVLNYRQAKSEEEEKHICPLQLDLINKMIGEYSGEGDIVFTPYGGIGSEPYTALKMWRKAISAELKPNYWKINCKNLSKAEVEVTQGVIK
jgi:DNA modification methylase